MIFLLQRVRHARVEVEQKIVGSIEQGLLVLVGIEANDDLIVAKKLLDKLLNYRVFADQNDKMNLSIQDIHGGLLLVPQFTLAADTDQGRRPGFSRSASPAKAQQIFESLVENAQQRYDKVQQGVFAADMQVHLQNDGPVTFILKNNNTK